MCNSKVVCYWCHAVIQHGLPPARYHLCEACSRSSEVRSVASEEALTDPSPTIQLRIPKRRAKSAH